MNIPVIKNNVIIVSDFSKMEFDNRAGILKIEQDGETILIHQRALEKMYYQAGLLEGRSNGKGNYIAKICYELTLKNIELEKENQKLKKIIKEL